MSWFESIVLALVQGLTEFLPISSSAHLRLVAAFTAISQIGTETVVLICSLNARRGRSPPSDNSGFLERS